MKILIDDHRTHLPDGSVPDIILRNARAATNFLPRWHFWAEDDTLYLDHDLGSDAYADWAGTGYDVLTWLEEWKQRNPNYELPGKMIVVSDNPAGRLRMELVIGKLYGVDTRAVTTPLLGRVEAAHPGFKALVDASIEREAARRRVEGGRTPPPPETTAEKLAREAANGEKVREEMTRGQRPRPPMYRGRAQ